MGAKKGATAGELLDALLKERGVTKVEFAQRLGIKRGTLYHRIRNNAMSTEQVVQAAKMLGVPPTYFFSDNGAVAFVGKDGTATAYGGAPVRDAELDALRERVASLEQAVIDKNKIIELYEKLYGGR